MKYLPNMQNNEIKAHKNKIDSLIRRIEKYSKTDFDLEIMSDLSKYACIQVSGYFDKSIFYLLLKYAEKHSNKELQKFVYEKLKRFSNASSGKIENLFKSYSKCWTQSIVSHPRYNELKGSINSLVRERNLIAHGEDSTISLARVKQYYQHAEILLVYIDSIM